VSYSQYPTTWGGGIGLEDWRIGGLVLSKVGPFFVRLICAALYIATNPLILQSLNPILFSSSNLAPHA
jgi:hypothetical protein